MKLVNISRRKGFRKFYICGECDAGYDDFARSAMHQVTYKVCELCGADKWKERVGKLSDCGEKIIMRKENDEN